MSKEKRIRMFDNTFSGMHFDILQNLYFAINSREYPKIYGLSVERKKFKFSF
jgi:hypothetical protein